jgi:hypothetical protein
MSKIESLLATLAEIVEKEKARASAEDPGSPEAGGAEGASAMGKFASAPRTLPGGLATAPKGAEKYN